MVNSFDVNWPDDIELIIFLKIINFYQNKISKKLVVLDYHQEIPEYKNFCEKFKHKEKYTDDFRLNAFRFAYKVYAINKAIKSKNSDYFIWLDSDIKTHKKIPLSFLESLISENCYLSYLVEVEKINLSDILSGGFLIFNTNHPIHSTFWELMMEMYNGGKLFYEKEWHDSYIFDQVRKKLEKERQVSNLTLVI